MSLHTRLNERRLYFPENLIFKQILSVKEMYTVQQYYVYYKMAKSCVSFQLLCLMLYYG